MNKTIRLIDKLAKKKALSKSNLFYLLTHLDKTSQEYLYQKARQTCQKYYQQQVFLRGLIEFSNGCHNNCLYCGINASAHVSRYYMQASEIIETIHQGYEMGFRSFVLQSGENSYYDKLLPRIIKEIKSIYPAIALTISIGEKPFGLYQALKEAGVDRFLLRHETYNAKIYFFHHQKPKQKRLSALNILRQLHYDIGAGFIVGLPKTTLKDHINDLLFLKKLRPEMVGIGPFIASEETIFKGYPNGSITTTLNLMAIIRLLLPNVLLPATTALNTLSTDGFLSGIRAGGNVIMPNITPAHLAKQYMLYNDKKIVASENGSNLEQIKKILLDNNYHPSLTRGDIINK